MRILEIACFCANYGSNFIPTLISFNKQCEELGHSCFFIFSDANSSEKFYEWEKPFAEQYPTTLLDFSSKDFVKQVTNYVIDNQIDIVHGHFISSLKFSEIKRHCPRNVKFYQHLHNSMYIHKNFFSFGKRIRNFLFLDKSIPKVCCSESIIESAKYSFPLSKVISCKNAIDLSRLEAAERSNAPFSILLFGHNYYFKGVDLAIRAVTELNKRYPIHLDIVMSNNMEKNRQTIMDTYGNIPSCVSLLEPVSNVVELYKNHAFFLNASIEEGMSYANIEAYYCGNLCIFSDIPQNKEPNLPNVIYFSSGSLDGLINAIDIAVHMYSDYRNDTNYVVQSFSIQSWADRMVRIMELQEKTI